MIPQGNTWQDLQNFRDAISEGEDTFEVPITIKRAVSQVIAPGAMLNQQATVWQSIPSSAVEVSMDVAAKFFASGVLSAGDLVLQISERLLESDANIGGTQLADRVIFEGMEYRMVGRPDCQHFGAVKSGICPFYLVHLRRTNSTSDVAGL